MRRPSAAAAALLSVFLLALGAGATLAGSPSDVEAGIFTDYLAPDPGTMTPGAITFGFLGSPEVIAPDAELVPPADTNLGFLVGGAPTCLEVTREAGEITRIAFVASCTVSGPVTLVADVFGPGAHAFMTSDRIVTPEAVVLGDPAINALMKTTADSGGVLTVTFQIDVGFGAPTGFAASTRFDGPVDVLATGDVRVGAALLLDAVIDPGSRALLERAEADGLDATVEVDGAGDIDVSGKSQPATAIVLTVTLATGPTEAPPSPSALLPDTSTVGAGEPSSAMGATFVVLGLLAVAAAAPLGRRRMRSGAAVRRDTDRPVG